MNKEELFQKARVGDVSILTHPDVSVIKDTYGNTPIHILAYKGKVEVLTHKDASISKDIGGDTILHILAIYKKKEIFDHKDVNVVINNDDFTPKDIYDLCV